MGIYYTPKSESRPDRHVISVEEYTHYRREGYLIAKGLLSAEEIAPLYALAEEERLRAEKLAKDPDIAGKPGLHREFALKTRVHMISRSNAVAEQGLLQPKIVDVVEALVGPDVYALQSMLFLNPPGLGGQGWHQDACYIRTHPETLIGAWIALEDVDEENGCLWVVPGSNHEPIYPPKGSVGGNVHAVDAFKDLREVENVSHLDDEVNTLAQVVANYPPAIPAPMSAGDVLFFHSHLFHRSYQNRTTDRFRRSYVLHYCNARSFVPWDHDGYEGPSGNHLHILARGKTDLPYASPKFGTKVYLSEGDDADGAPAPMMGMDGMMTPVVEVKA